MKLERIKRRSGGSLFLEMTPLIDVIFLLLIFFMLATTFDDKTAFKIELPKTTLKKNINSIKEIQILIDQNKNIHLKYSRNSKSTTEKINISNLKNVIEEKLKSSESKDIIITADKKNDYGYVVEIMSILKEAGADSINLDTEIKR